MTFWYFALFLLVLVSGVHPQITLVEDGPTLVKPSDTIDLSCTVIGYSISGGSWWNWFRQPPGKGLQWLGWINSNGDIVYSPTFQNRITITRDTSANKYFLKMREAKAEDSARYYCAREAQCEKGSQSCDKIHSG